MQKIYVTITDHNDTVTCPICGQVLQIEEGGQILEPCPHLDREDYITPHGPFETKYDVWFVIPVKECTGCFLRDQCVGCVACARQLDCPSNANYASECPYFVPVTPCPAFSDRGKEIKVGPA